MPNWNVGQTDTGTGSLWGPGNGNRVSGNDNSRSRRTRSGNLPGQVADAVNGLNIPSSASGITSGISGSWYDMLQGISASNNAFNLAQVDAVNHFNAHEAQKNRDWQERMSNTAHQREVKDLIAAGLNPVLSAGGQGAVTPSGGVASGQKAVADNVLGNGVISLMGSMISAASAQSVAGIYAAAQMYGDDLKHNDNAAYRDLMRELQGGVTAKDIWKAIPSLINAITSIWKG